MAQTGNNAASDPATTETILYTAPSAAPDLYTIMVQLMICNTTGTAESFRVWRSIGGGVAVTVDAIYFDEPISANRTFELTTPMMLQPADEIRVRASATGVVFNCSVLEVDNL